MKTKYYIAVVCLSLAAEIGGRPVTELTSVITDEQISPLLRRALNALLTGMLLQLEKN